jgi:hypothetical protein
MGAKKIQPPRKIIKRIIAGVSLFSLGRAFQTASVLDDTIKQEIEDWPEGYTVVMKVMPHGPLMAVVKTGDRLKYAGGKDRPADLSVMFKNLESALLVLTARQGTPQAYAEHRIGVRGDLGRAMALTRCLNITQTYLFPKLICSRIMKQVPKIPLTKLLRIRAIIFASGVPLGRP